MKHFNAKIPVAQSNLLKAKDLNIGDVVILAQGYPKKYVELTATKLTVINKTDENITVFHPYTSLADFTYTGGVIPYIGMEKFDVIFSSPCEYVRVDNIYRERQ